MASTSTDSSKDGPASARPSVAIIGCGPGGMFFLHAVATRRKQMEAKGDVAGLARLPNVSCFERASEPGGVWRASRREERERLRSVSSAISETTEAGDDEAKPKTKKDAEKGGGRKSKDEVNAAETEGVTTNMYEALWTNGPKEAVEFFDYTFDEHFHRPLPIYMPRQPLLEYMMCRVTRNNPNFFDDVKFNTTVQSVTYNDMTKKFVVVTVDESMSTTIGEYDKCIWAAGENGHPYIPSSVSDALAEGSFAGKAMHSSNTDDFENDVRGKRVVIIGDSYSAEDLALQAVKLGVEKVYICSRSGEGIASYMGAWPMDKVEVLSGMMPTEVIQDGYGLKCSTFGYNNELWKYELDEDGESVDLKDISTVIYCTGYKGNMTMLDESLRRPFDHPDEFHLEDVPSDWKMTHNHLTDEFGDVTPHEEISSETVRCGLYRGALISNPSMMFIVQNSDVPLMEIDVNAWLLLALITGDVATPSEAEMEQFNASQILAEMQVPNLRYYIDTNYYLEWCKVSSSHWSCDLWDPRTKDNEADYVRFFMRVIARDMMDSGYPFDIGTFNKLNEKGEALVSFSLVCGYARYDLKPDSKDSSWKTFRDCDPSENYSIITGTRAVPLKKRWLDIDEDDCGITDDVEVVTPKTAPHSTIGTWESSSKHLMLELEDMSTSPPATEALSENSSEGDSIDS